MCMGAFMGGGGAVVAGEEAAERICEFVGDDSARGPAGGV